jgi:hypothetical protein
MRGYGNGAHLGPMVMVGRKMASFNGILCCQRREMELGEKMALFRPSTKDHMWAFLPFSQNTFQQHKQGAINA